MLLFFMLKIDLWKENVMEFRKIKISDLKHAEYNPRVDLKPGDKEFEKIKSSITEFGYCEPIICICYSKSGPII